MGNALYSRMACKWDATSASVSTIPEPPGSTAVAAPSTLGGTAGGRGGAVFSRAMMVMNQRLYTVPQFRQQHVACGTDDDECDSPFFAVAQHQLMRHARLLQLQFALFTLYLWNYLSSVRVMFGQDDYGTKVAAGEYLNWMLFSEDVAASDASWLQLPSHGKSWIALLYLSCTVAGLVSIASVTVSIVWQNVRSHCHHDKESSDPPRVFLERPKFVYARSDSSRSFAPHASSAYALLDEHAEFHEAYGDEYRGEVAPLLVYIGYIFILPLCVMDLGIVSDLTYQGTNRTIVETSYGASKVGDGIGVLRGFLLAVGLLYVIIPPRRWYQYKAEAYLAERYY